jgi:DNA-binding NarL/FixJ family response regulator
MSEPIRILIADDHPVVRDGLVAILGTQTDFQVVGQAASGAETVSKAGALRPDVLLLDLEMPDMGGVEALEQIHAAYPEVQVIVFTAFDSDERILSSVQAGARGYILKGDPREEIFNAIRVVSQGGSLLQPVVASRLLRHVRENPHGDQAPASPLTERESQVLALLAQGKSNQAISDELTISLRTVKFHVSSILSKLGAENRTEAVSIAAQKGLVEL